MTTVSHNSTTPSVSVTTASGNNQSQLVATPVPDEQRISFWPQHFGLIPQWVTLEPRVFGWMDRLCEDYCGGIWNLYTLNNGVAFTSTRAAREWLILNMAGLEREEFRVLYLNNQNQLIAGETLFTGTINRTEVHPREVIKRALYHNAAAVVLAHNHPSGEVTPSKADRLITERLVQALGLVDIRVPDHLIVGGNQVFSFAEHGLL
ncbi:RadC family protein [Escherichia coli]|nr:RadC family protein [Escherichia coli]